MATSYNDSDPTIGFDFSPSEKLTSDLNIRSIQAKPFPVHQYGYKDFWNFLEAGICLATDTRETEGPIVADKKYHPSNFISLIQLYNSLSHYPTTRVVIELWLTLILSLLSMIIAIGFDIWNLQEMKALSRTESVLE
ncbi:hypothetical protein PPACK8108_LOCUS4356 [Phakopsora pachyrhizi]|uniref:Uncharacterized protein n=1 Tax=Phakopsora pachyrhizi TaxID=170000 RepID=A0AAV0API6_PHAPC|nr:hypothetical protein PPACK8108_LOCUS4356 [Phakopsora pachyrhizi]